MSNNKFKVLIIEDEANICSFIQTLLETNGYQALVAQTCVMGMTMFISYNPDLVILDLGLPDRDGLDAIRSIRQKYLTPIIVLSARTTEQDKIEALDLGANDYITKPFGTGELLARVRERPGECGIVYCSTRKNVEEVCQFLQSSGISAKHRSVAHSHRVQKRQPFGRCKRFGTTPSMV